MGPACTNCNSCKGQENTLEFETDYVFSQRNFQQKNRSAYAQEYSHGKHIPTNSKSSPPMVNQKNLNEEITKAVKERPTLLRRIIKVQALYRAYLTRKKLKEALQSNNTDNLDYVENYKFPNGAVYTGNIYLHCEGQWKNNARHGHGVQVWPDGARYEGEWRNNQAYGKGKFWHVDGDVFEGEWKNDKANGYGVYTHKNGARYEGEWKDDFQHGHGVETWADNSKYDGEYKNGKKDGKGTYYWADGSEYSGQWEDNKINGKVIRILLLLGYL